MVQSIIPASPEQFYYSMNFNARRRPQIKTTCSAAEDIVLKVAQEFQRETAMLPPVSRVSTGNSIAHKGRLLAFYKHRALIRVVVQGNDKRGGFVILNGELMGLHHVDAGKGEWLLQEAIRLGADRLDCFDIPHLMRLYMRYGFRELSREPNHKPGQPDVVWLGRDKEQ